METKKLVVKGIIFFSIGSVILHALAVISRYWAPDSTSFFLIIDQRLFDNLFEHPNTAEEIALGNSHGDDLDFSLINENGYQLSRAWGDFFEIKYYLEYLIPRLPKLETVYIPVSYFSFFWDNASGKTLSIRRSQLYTVIPSWTYIEGDIKNFISGRGDRVFPIQSVIREDNWKSVVSALISGKSAKLSDIDEENCRYMSKEELIDVSIKRVNETLDLANDIQSKRPTVIEDNYLTVKEIIDYLHTHDIKVIFFTPPYYEAYKKAYIEQDPQAVETLKTYMDKLVQEFGIEYYDFSTDSGYTQNHELFKDSDHLNLCGKRLFSKEFDDLTNGEHPNQ